MNIVTITSQGQITLPASVRRALNLKASDTLELTFNSETRNVTLQKPITVDEFVQYAAKVKRNNHPPIQNVHDYYEQERGKDIMRPAEE